MEGVGVLDGVGVLEGVLVGAVGVMVRSYGVAVGVGVEGVEGVNVLSGGGVMVQVGGDL